MAVRYPRLPCVQYGQKNYVPLEFVHLVEFNRIPMLRLTGEQQADMIRVAAKKPRERLALSESLCTLCDLQLSCVSPAVAPDS